MYNMKKVIVTGVVGQDGANMVEYLLANTDAQVFGMMRRSANPNYENLQKVINNARFKIVYGDLTDSVSIDNLVRTIKPDYFINFAANSFVGCSWKMPLQVFDANTLGVIRCLEAIKRYQPTCRFYQAGSSEEFGNVQYSPQDMKHPMMPRSPYGASKCAAHHIVKVYRESYNLYAVCGVLFNHEGTKRGEEFVTRKISKGVAKIYRQLEAGQEPTPIELGNVDSIRDWSDSEDFMDGVWRMLNQEIYRADLKEELDKAFLTFDEEKTRFISKRLKEYILANGQANSIRQFVNEAFEVAQIKGVWTNPIAGNNPLNEVFVTREVVVDKPLKTLVRISKEFYRPAEVDCLLGDNTEAIKELGWTPKTTFKELVKKMVVHDIELTKKIV